MEGESGVTAGIIDEILSQVIRGDQMDCAGGVTRSFIDELLS